MRKGRKMAMDTIIAQFGICGMVMEANTKDITHEESLTQPGDGGNCMNWILGHLTKVRSEMVGLLGQSSPYPPEKFVRYAMGGARLTEAGEALAFEELLAAYNALQAPVVGALQSATEEVLARPVPDSPTGNPDETVGSLMVLLAFHEAYHIGQLGLLRAMLGKPRLMP